MKKIDSDKKVGTVYDLAPGLDLKELSKELFVRATPVYKSLQYGDKPDIKKMSQKFWFAENKGKYPSLQMTLSLMIQLGYKISITVKPPTK